MKVRSLLILIVMALLVPVSGSSRQKMKFSFETSVPFEEHTVIPLGQKFGTIQIKSVTFSIADSKKKKNKKIMTAHFSLENGSDAYKWRVDFALRFVDKKGRVLARSKGGRFVEKGSFDVEIEKAVPEKVLDSFHQAFALITVGEV